MRLMGGGEGGARGAAHRAAVAKDGSLLLALEDGEERLPWLGGEDEDEDEEAPVDGSRVAAFALGLLLVLAVLAGAAFWLWQERNAAPPADGSIIEAPEGPYKVRPSGRGAAVVAGTGSASFKVGEGESVEGRIASEPVPVVSTEAGEGEDEDMGAGEAPDLSGVGVQIGAYPTREAAQAGWQQLHQRLEPLHGHSHRILEGTSDSAPVFRLQAVTPSLTAAQDLCRSLREVGGDCQVKR